MIERRQKTITVYVVSGEEYSERADAIAAALTRTLSGHLNGSRSSIMIEDLAHALTEPAIRHAFRTIIDDETRGP